MSVLAAACVQRMTLGADLPLPKITAPRAAQLYPRERLFDWFDRSRAQHRLLWVNAPGGAGKTSLMASYLATRELPVLWYQVDAGDGDIASFFFYMWQLCACQREIIINPRANAQQRVFGKLAT